MKQKLTIRLDEEVYRKLYFYANERKISVNKLVSSMIDRCIDVPRDADFFGNVMSCLKSLDKKIETISKRQYLHFKVSKQHFANFGYLSNAAINKDKQVKRLNKIEEIINNTPRLEEFNADCFNNMVDKIIIGEIDENGNKNNNVIKFILNTGKNYDFLIDSQKYCMSFRKRNK